MSRTVRLVLALASMVLDWEHADFAPRQFRSSAFVLLLFLGLIGSAVPAQAPPASGDYTTALPSVEKVKAQITGTNPNDTLARQIAVFEYLQSYIQRIKLARDYGGPYSPGEQKLLTDYAKAQYDLFQSYTKSHTPDQIAAFNQLEGKYSINNALDWIKQLQGQQAADTYKGAEAEYAASSKRFHDKIQSDVPPDPSVQSHTLNAQGLANDPTAVATRRCLELGGEPVACMGKGFMGGLMDMVTGGAGLGELTGPGPAGPFLSGNYGNSSHTSLGFSDSTVTLIKCGVLSDDSYPYTLNKSGSLQVKVATNPRPILLTMRSDGELVGPGPITIDGRIITGYHVETVRHYKGGYLTGTSTERTPIYAPKTDRCSVSTLEAPAPPRPASASTKEDTGLLGGLTGFVGTIAPGDLPGIRMEGKYDGSTGMLLEFAGDAVTLDCGQAHVKAPYTVENAASQILVHVQNGGGPFTLAVASDSTLRGSGSTSINGRLVTGMNGDDVTFAPHSESCTIGAFSPKGGANTRFASASTAGAPPPAAAVPAGVTPVAAVSPAASSGTIKLAVTTSFPGGINPLAGRPVMLMSDRFDNALRKSGAPIPADATPGKALQAYAANCLPPKNCGVISTTMTSYYVAKAMFDSTGKVIMDASVQPGAYYVFSSASSGGAALVWDLPIEIKTTGNAITLQTSNAEVIR